MTNINYLGILISFEPSMEKHTDSECSWSISEKQSNSTLKTIRVASAFTDGGGKSWVTMRAEYDCRCTHYSDNLVHNFSFCSSGQDCIDFTNLSGLT